MGVMGDGTGILPDNMTKQATPLTPASEEQDIYFSELLGYTVDRLGREPELLRAEQDQLARQVQETSVTNYRSFITTAQCLVGLQQQLGEMAASLDALDADLPKLQAAADAFRRDGMSLNARREANRRLYAAHPGLLDLLEIPALMDTCIRSGNFDEALDLRAYANKLSVVHGELPIVRHLVEDVASTSDAMLEQLLARLAGAIQLPECLRVIGFLRRLALFPETELRLHFLQRREAWIASMAADLDDRSAYEFLKRLTDVYRLHVFDVTMQYRAIFADSAPSTTNLPSTNDDGGILSAWAERRIAAYLDAVASHLPQITDGGGLASVLDHVMYCGASLGRVGLDFRPLVAPLFESAALRLFSSGLASSNDALSTMLENHRWVAMSSAGSRAAQLRQQQGEQQQNKAGEEGGAEEKGTDLGPPPPTLVEHPPLAVYANGLLAALNELRHCAPYLIRESAASALQNSLLGAVAAVVHVQAVRTLNETEQPVFKAACTALITALCPYISACFDRLFPGSAALLDLQAVAAELSQA
ncbi:hypothetical protein Ndes2526B_g06178 [Nannochloris sp. 'desiccata']|nr:putative Conserved oligomeric Golgi complex subunit 8 [Chlorella desiccata (nom. nud.)]